MPSDLRKQVHHRTRSSWSMLVDFGAGEGRLRADSSMRDPPRHLRDTAARRTPSREDRPSRASSNPTRDSASDTPATKTAGCKDASRAEWLLWPLRVVFTPADKSTRGTARIANWGYAGGKRFRVCGANCKGSGASKASGNGASDPQCESECFRGVWRRPGAPLSRHSDDAKLAGQAAFGRHR
jgi:hypothetical protein